MKREGITYLLQTFKYIVCNVLNCGSHYPFKIEMPLEQTIVKIGFTITLIHLLQTVTYNVYFVSDCGEPFSPVNGYFLGSSFLEDDVVYYECEEGYELKGDEESTCQHDGTWTFVDVSCQSGIIIMSYYFLSRDSVVMYPETLSGLNTFNVQSYCS